MGGYVGTMRGENGLKRQRIQYAEERQLKLRMEVRLALSYEALKMNGTFKERATPLITSAIKRACFSLSITHGPAMRNKPPEPTLMPSIWKETDIL